VKLWGVVGGGLLVGDCWWIVLLGIKHRAEAQMPGVLAKRTCVVRESYFCDQCAFCAQCLTVKEGVTSGLLTCLQLRMEGMGVKTRGSRAV
jgi:hypothetical protein